MPRATPDVARNLERIYPESDPTELVSALDPFETDQLHVRACRLPGSVNAER
jgi:hypothetical protein